MLYLDSLDDKPQVLYINSPGGEISPALAIYDTMTSLKSQVGTVAFGHAWSIAAFLLAAGTKVGAETLLFHRHLRFLIVSELRSS